MWWYFNCYRTISVTVNKHLFSFLSEIKVDKFLSQANAEVYHLHQWKTKKKKWILCIETQVWRERREKKDVEYFTITIFIFCLELKKWQRRSRERHRMREHFHAIEKSGTTSQATEWQLNLQVSFKQKRMNISHASTNNYVCDA